MTTVSHQVYGALDGEADVLALIVALRERDRSFGGIAEILNAEGIAARCGGRWYPATIRKIVRRECLTNKCSLE